MDLPEDSDFPANVSTQVRTDEPEFFADLFRHIDGTSAPFAHGWSAQPPVQIGRVAFVDGGIPIGPLAPLAAGVNVLRVSDIYRVTDPRKNW